MSSVELSKLHGHSIWQSKYGHAMPYIVAVDGNAWQQYRVLQDGLSGVWPLAGSHTPTPPAWTLDFC